MEIDVGLRPNQANVGDGFTVHEKLLVGLVPAHHRLGGVEHATVLLICSYVMPPRLDAASEAIEHPQARFRFRFAGKTKSGIARLIHRHAFRDEFVPAQQPMNEFSGFAIVLKSAGVTARLMVQHDDFRALANRLIITEALALADDRPAVHANPDAIQAASGTGD